LKKTIAGLKLVAEATKITKITKVCFITHI
jgi:hypothetical protein